MNLLQLTTSSRFSATLISARSRPHHSIWLAQLHLSTQFLFAVKLISSSSAFTPKLSVNHDTYSAILTSSLQFLKTIVGKHRHQSRSTIKSSKKLHRQHATSSDPSSRTDCIHQTTVAVQPFHLVPQVACRTAIGNMGSCYGTTARQSGQMADVQVAFIESVSIGPTT